MWWENWNPTEYLRKYIFAAKMEQYESSKGNFITEILGWNSDYLLVERVLWLFMWL